MPSPQTRSFSGPQVTYVAIVGALLATAAAALVLPVRRALLLAPVDALRRE